MKAHSPATKYFLWFRPALIMIVGGTFAIILGLAWLGFPRIVTRWILASVNDGDYYVQAHDVKLDLRGGLKARDVMIYRKGITGPPFLESRELRVLFRLFERPAAGQTRLKALQANEGILRPLWGLSPSGRKHTTKDTSLLGTVRQENDAIRIMDVDVALSDFDVLGVWVEKVHTSVVVDAEGVRLNRLSGEVGRDLHRGSVEGQLVWLYSGLFSGRVVTAFDPHALLPICRSFYPQAVGMLDRFSFPTTPPRLDITFEAGMFPDLTLTARGRVQAANYAYRGAVIGLANLMVEYSFGNGTNRLKLDPFSIMIGGRNARGQVEFDFGSGSANFRVRSEVDMAAILRLLGLKERLMDPWHFEKGALMLATGRVDFVHPETSEVDAAVEGAKVEIKGIPLTDYAFKYQNRGYAHAFTDIKGKTGGGSVSGSAQLSVGQPGTNWVAHVTAEIINADADEVLKMISAKPNWRLEGKAFGNLEVSVGGGDMPMAGLSGRGQLTVRKAGVFKNPLASGLVATWGQRVRTMDLAGLYADARFSFAIKDGRLSSQDLIVEGAGFGLEAQGSSGFDGSLDWIVKPVVPKSKGALGQVLTTLFSPVKTSGYSLTGTFENPVWRPAVSDRKE
ncbi:MAG: AsmA-like C-terminal region-containing protein [bacterium]